MQLNVYMTLKSPRIYNAGLVCYIHIIFIRLKSIIIAVYITNADLIQSETVQWCGNYMDLHTCI